LFGTAAEDVIEEEYSRKQAFIYMMESWLAQRKAQYITLVMVGLIQILLGGLIWMAVHEPSSEEEQHPFLEGIWAAWTMMADPGTHSDVTLPKQRVVGSLIAVGGIVFFAALIGVVVDAIRNKMDSLRQGRSRVIERNHSLILGWTEKAILLIQELCVANLSEGGGVVVVLSTEGKEAMEAELNLQLPKKQLLGTKVVFRNGSPMLMHDLVKVGAHVARSVIVLANEGEPDQADAATLRCILALRTLPYGMKGCIVAEVRDIDNEPLLKMVGGSQCETVPSHDILGRLMLMAGRQPGLAKVYESLLGFEGDEFYMWEWPELIGISFTELIERFPDAVPIGICNAAGNITLNPPPETIVIRGDKIVVIAEDDDTYRPEAPAHIDEGSGPPVADDRRKPEMIFIAGWRRDIRDVLVHLDNLVERGSQLHMMTHCVSVRERDEKLAEDGLEVSSLKNISLVHHFGNTSVRRKLVNLPLLNFTSCMIFADQAFELDTMHADSHSLATLLLIRDMQSEETCPIVCEILDPRTQKTISNNRDVQRSSEFCHSNLMIAQIMAMVSENRSVKHLLDEMLGYVGCSVSVIPASRFVHSGEKASFWTISKRASRMQTSVLGYATRGHTTEKPKLNPRDKTAAKNWEGFDLVAIVGAKHNHCKLERRTTRAPTMQAFNPEDSCDTPPGENADENRRAPKSRRARDGNFTVDPPDDLEGKVMRLAECIASAEVNEAECCKLANILDRLKDVVETMPASGDLSAVKQRLSEKRKQRKNLADLHAASMSHRCLCQDQA